METRREEDERNRALLEQWYGPVGQPLTPAMITSGAPSPPTLAVRLQQSASEVIELLRNSPAITPLRIDTEGSAPAYAYRDQLLLDESGPDPRLWERPPVDEYEGVLEARLAVRTYMDVAVVQLVDKHSGGCELVVAWELHPKTRRYRRYRYAQALGLVLVSAALFGFATFAGIVLLAVPIYLFELGRKSERDAFDAVAVIRGVIDEAGVVHRP